MNECVYLHSSHIQMPRVLFHSSLAQLQDKHSCRTSAGAMTSSNSLPASSHCVFFDCTLPILFHFLGDHAIDFFDRLFNLAIP